MTLRSNLRALYTGRTRTARAFRYGLIAFDVASIAFFVATSFIPADWTIYVIDYLIAVVIAADLAARFWIADRPLRMLGDIVTWCDIVVILTLLAPAVLTNFLFLRVARVLRLLRSYRMLRDLREEFPFFRRNEEVIQSTVNLSVFIFVMTAVVYVLEVNTNPKITNYIDALYFTVTTLTTTGFGDITLEGTYGRMLSVLIMIFGVGLFLRLVQTIFRPTHVRFPCPDCGLRRHDADAVHCKHCGRVLNIPNDGFEG